jgi:hypothetical protein
MQRSSPAARSRRAGPTRAAIAVQAILAISAAALPACTSKSHQAANANEGAAVRAEQRDVDAAVAHVPGGSRLVDSYRIDGEILTVLVAGPGWHALGTQGQDALKASLWQRWNAAYMARHAGSSERTFVKIEDLQGNDLGSYFQ